MDAPTILVVDDDAALRRLLEMALQRAGFTVFLAGTGSEAIEAYRRQLPSLVLMDVQMPVMDGPETLDLLRRTDPGVRCCLMTGGTSYTTDELLERGALRVIDKPFNLERLTAVLWQVLGRSAAA